MMPALERRRCTRVVWQTRACLTLEYWVAVTMSSGAIWVLALGLRAFMRLVTKLALEVRGSARVSRASPAMTRPGGPIQNKRVLHDDSASLVKTTCSSVPSHMSIDEVLGSASVHALPLS
jgi:hypothetical protein